MAQPLLDPPSTNLLVLNLRIVPYSFTRLSSEQLWYTCRYQETHMQLHQGFPRKLFLPNCDDDAPVSPVDTGMLDFIERSAMRDLQLLQVRVRIGAFECRVGGGGARKQKHIGRGQFFYIIIHIRPFVENQGKKGCSKYRTRGVGRLPRDPIPCRAVITVRLYGMGGPSRHGVRVETRRNSCRVLDLFWAEF